MLETTISLLPGYLLKRKKKDLKRGGYLKGILDLDPSAGTYQVSTAGGYDGFVEKLDSNGIFQWGQRFGSTGQDMAYFVNIDVESNIYVSGIFSGTVDFDATSAVESKISKGGMDAFLMKLSGAGLFQWVNTWGGTADDFAKGIGIDSNNNIKVGGLFNGTVDFDPGPNSYILTSTDSINSPVSWYFDASVSMFDKNGNFYGVQCIGQPIQGDDMWTTTYTQSGSPVITGAFAGTIDFDPDSPNKSIAGVGGANQFLTQWNRLFTKTTLSVSDSFTGANTVLTAMIQNENNTSTTGTVTFTDLSNGTTTTLGTANVVNGVASLTLASLTTGVHNFTASYSGDTTDFSSTSNPVITQLDAVAGSWGWAQAQVNRVGTEDNSTYIRQVRLTTDDLGNIYQVGSFSGTIDFNAGTGTKSLTAVTTRDFYVAKFDPNGTLLWINQWSNSSIEFSKLLIDPLNRLNVVGSFSGTFDSDPSSTISNLVSNGGTDGMVIRFDKNGNFIDSKSVGGTGNDSIYSIAYDLNLNQVISGYFTSTVDFDPSSSIVNRISSGNEDGFVAKYYQSGGLFWVNTYGSSASDNVQDVDVDPNSNVYVLGTTDGTVDLDSGPGITNNVGNLFVLKLSPNGSYIKSGGSTASKDYVTTTLNEDAQIKFSNNAIYVGFSTRSSSTFFGRSVSTGGDLWGITICKLDVNLDLKWLDVVKGTLSNRDRSFFGGLSVDQLGNVYVGGCFQGTVDLDSSSTVVNVTSVGTTSSGSTLLDILYLKIDTNGAYLTSGTYGSPNFDWVNRRATSISETGSLVLGGTFAGLVDFDPTTSILSLNTDPNVANAHSRFVMSLANLGPVTTATSLTTTPTSSVFGQSITLNAGLTALNGATPSGLIVSFYDGTTLLGTATVTNGLASFTTSNLAVGVHSLTAKIVDSTNAYLTSTSTAVAYTVNKTNTNTTFSASANPSVYGQSVTFTATASAMAPGAGVPTGTVTFKDGTSTLGTGTLNSSGVATFAISSLGIGSHSITAVYGGDSNSMTSTSTALSQTVVAGSASILTLTSGNNQSTTVATDFASLLQVKATDSSGNPVANVSVTFAVIANGASGSFASSSTVTTNSSGFATAPKLTANTVAGNFTVTVSATGVSNVVFNLTNTAGAASAIVLTNGNNQNATVNSAFAQPLQARIVDSYGNPIAGIPVTFSVPSTGATGSFAASNVVTTNAGGFATAPTLSANTVAGSYQVSTSATGLIAQNFNLTNSPGAAANITIQDGNNQSATVGAAFAKSLQILAKDAYGNSVSGFAVTFTAPNTGATGTFASSSSITTNSTGVATSPVFTANTVAGTYQVVASANGLTSQNFNLTNNAGIATGFAIVAGNNQTVTVGNAFATNLQVKATDTYGNGVSGVSVQFSAPGSGAGGSFAGSNVVTTNSQGIAIATTFTSNTISGNYTVQASATGLPTQTFNLTNSTSGALISIIAGNNQSTTVGTGFGTSLQVKFSDSFGNPVSGVSVTFAAPATGASGTFNGSATVTSNASGIATAPAFSANGKSGSFTVTASAANIGSVNFTVINTAGAASTILVVSGNNQTTTVNTAFGSPLIAKVTDTFGNPVPNFSVTFSGPGSGSLAVFGGSTIISSNADGIAASPAISANTVSGTYTVIASAPNVSSTQFTLTNAAGLPTSIVKTGGNNQAIAVNSAFVSPLSVKVSDIYGNPVPNVNVAFSGPTTGPALAFSGASTVATNASGVATTPAISANAIAGNYSVLAYVSGAVNENFTLTNLAGAASKLVSMSGTNQSAIVNTAFASALQVLVTDAFANPVSNVAVAFTGPASGAGITLTGNQNANSNASGIASWSSFAANQIAGNYIVVASIAGGSNLNFNLSNRAGAAAIATVSSGANQSTVVNTVFGTALQVKVTDTFGNPVSNVPVTFTAPSIGASATFSGSTSVNTNADGQANAPILTANTIAGNYIVTANVGDFNQLRFTLSNLAGAAATIAKTSGNNQSTQVATVFTNPLQVKVSDAYGNPVANVPVSFNAPRTGASLTLASTTPVTTNSQGIATSPAITANTEAGSYSVNVTANGNVSDFFNLTNLAGSPSKVSITSGDNQSATVNNLFTKGLQVLITDGYNNPVPNTTVTFNLPNSGAGVVLTGSNVVNTGLTGNALLDGLTANRVAGSFTVMASVPNVQAISFNLSNTPGAVAAIVPVNGNNQSTLVNAAFPSALQVKVIDAFGNSVPNVPVTFAAPSTRASLQFTAGATANTDGAGFAQSSAMIANGIIGTYNVTASTAGAASINFNMTNVAPTVSSMIVQQNALGRSFVRYVDLVLNDAATAKAIASSVNTSASRISMTNTGLTGTTKKVVTLKGLVTAVGNAIHIDFGSKGIGGNSASNAADGSYLISLDMDGNGSLETSRRFHRLLGDVNGDKIVNANDTNLVKANLNKSGFNIPGDSNGDGKVNATDSSYVKKAQKRKISV